MDNSRLYVIVSTYGFNQSWKRRWFSQTWSLKVVKRESRSYLDYKTKLQSWSFHTFCFDPVGLLRDKIDSVFIKSVAYYCFFSIVYNINLTTLDLFKLPSDPWMHLYSRPRTFLFVFFFFMSASAWLERIKTVSKPKTPKRKETVSKTHISPILE